FDGAKVREVNEEALVGLGEAGTHGGDELGIAEVDVAVDEVAADLDLRGDSEGFGRSPTEVGGDGGDAVGLLDAEFCDGEVGAVKADEGDVSAVKGGDEGEMVT